MATIGQAGLLAGWQASRPKWLTVTCFLSFSSQEDTCSSDGLDGMVILSRNSVIFVSLVALHYKLSECRKNCFSHCHLATPCPRHVPSCEGPLSVATFPHIDFSHSNMTPTQNLNSVNVWESWPVSSSNHVTEQVMSLRSGRTPNSQSSAKSRTWIYKS